MEEFSKQKIVYQELTQGSSFALDLNGEYMVSNTGYLISGNDIEYLIISLNSKLIEYVFKRFYSVSLGESGIRWLSQCIMELPIKKITNNQDYSTMLKESDNNKNNFIYQLYNLSEEEVRFIEEL